MPNFPYSIGAIIAILVLVCSLVLFLVDEITMQRLLALIAALAVARLT